MAAGGLTKQQIAEAEAIGLTPEDFADEQVEVWPCCAEAVTLFLAMSTQWRVGPGGATGLDYAALPVVLQAAGIKRKHLRRLFGDLRTLEGSALAAMHKD